MNIKELSISRTEFQIQVSFLKRQMLLSESLLVVLDRGRNKELEAGQR